MSVVPGYTPVTTPSKRPRVDRGSLPATYRGQRVPRPFEVGHPQSRNVRPRTDMARRRYRTMVTRRRRRGRRSLRRRRIPRSLAPKSMLLKCQTVSSGQLTCTSTTPQNIYVSRLDITDPFLSSDNNQPLGYDQWKAVYNRAKVLGVRVTWTCHNAGTVAVMVGITPIPEGENVAQTPWEYNAESTGTRYRILSPEMDHTTLSYKGSTKRFFRLNDIKDTEEIACDIDAETGPSRDATITCWAALHNGVTSTAVDYVCKVEYIVLLDKPEIPGRSVG